MNQYRPYHIIVMLIWQGWRGTWIIVSHQMLWRFEVLSRRTVNVRRILLCVVVGQDIRRKSSKWIFHISRDRRFILKFKILIIDWAHHQHVDDVSDLAELFRLRNTNNGLSTINIFSCRNLFTITCRNHMAHYRFEYLVFTNAGTIFMQ